ncbi:carcinoembryonic antigen-related cell adhesion molecule 19 isoform X2 [Hyla sarda]|uniref:carcinoembryonic antigen-related cell adhesion molecule 19 isoform X2 n=1 Tax=Hyla sarda TaxID=327740 RepID=UPI0024C30F3D|nr:carcinoembryonic antigen-related cell adhesion molecule 19 isoform X2 [Hyla sarda]
MVGGSCYDTPRQVEEAAVWNDPLLQERRSTGESHNGPSSAMRGFIITETIIDKNDNYIGLTPESILGLAFAVIFGALLIIIGGVCLYWKCLTKRMNEFAV